MLLKMSSSKIMVSLEAQDKVADLHKIHTEKDYLNQVMAVLILLMRFFSLGIN